MAESVAHDPLEGTSYEAIRLLGRGGQGSVWEARHRSLGHAVAVKLLDATDPELMSRLRLEALVLARLGSEHIVRVDDLGLTPDGRAFFAMERLEGETLRQRLAREGALTPSYAVDIANQILAGLEVAHAAGLVHRDIKPDNVFLTTRPDGSTLVKLLDFGVVKALESAEVQGVGTATGVVVGTPAYTAPEQLLGASVDARTDLYAVGLVLYAMIVGRRAFRHHKQASDLFVAQVREVPKPPSSLRPVLPRWLDEVVMRALEKRPAHRFASAADMRAALARGPRVPIVVTTPVELLAPTVAMEIVDLPPPTPLADAAPTTAPTIAPKPRRTAAGWTLVALLVLLATAATLLAMRGLA